jgi:hypothetical protein
MHALVQHLRYTLRLLRKSPGFTITAVLILSFGIGVNTAIFSLMDAALLKPLPFPDPDRLVEVCTPYQKESFHWMDYPAYLDLAAAQHSFESLAALTGPLALDLGGTREAQQVLVRVRAPGDIRKRQSHLLYIVRQSEPEVFYSVRSEIECFFIGTIPQGKGKCGSRFCFQKT